MEPRTDPQEPRETRPAPWQTRDPGDLAEARWCEQQRRPPTLEECYNLLTCACGGQPRIDGDSRTGRGGVHCSKCDYRTADAANLQNAVNEWNERQAGQEEQA